MRVLGVDPGVSPRVALLTRKGGGNRVLSIPDVHHEPDEAVLRAFLVEERPDRAVVERVGAMAGQGLASTAHLMTSWGLIRGILCGLGIPYVLVTPQTWKKALFTDAERGVDIEDAKARKEHQKASAVAYVQRRYPRLQLIQGRARTPDHNLAEAVMLAHWGIYGKA